MTDAAQDPHQEPSGGEVEGWMGQEVAQDEELVDQLIEEEGGDVSAAEDRFEDESAAAQPDAQDTDRSDAG